MAVSTARPLPSCCYLLRLHCFVRLIFCPCRRRCATGVFLRYASAPPPSPPSFPASLESAAAADAVTSAAVAGEVGGEGLVQRHTTMQLLLRMRLTCSFEDASGNDDSNELE